MKRHLREQETDTRTITVMEHQFHAYWASRRRWGRKVPVEKIERYVKGFQVLTNELAS